MIKLSKPIVFFDLETTGVSTGTDKIVQIAITKVFPDGQVVHKERLINPGKPIPQEATDVHGITDEMVKDAPLFKQVAKALKQEFDGCDLGGYNSDNFDIPMLSAEFERCEILFPEEGTTPIDVLKIERIVNSHKLGETFKRYTGQDLDNAHNASADTDATRIVLEHQIPKLLEILKQENEDFDGVLTPEVIDKFCQGENERFDFAGKTYIKDGVVFWSFGKCKDKPVLEDRGYLNWVLGQDFPLETKNKLKSLLTQKSN
jgi:DNA polymerase-3 subunit epsilon